MGRYLQNLIARHRPGAAGPGAKGIVHPRLASRFEDQSTAPPMPDSAMREPESASVASPAAPVRTGPARPERPAGMESRAIPEAHRPRRAHAARQHPDPGASDAGRNAIDHPAKRSTETGSPPRTLRTAPEPDSLPRRSRDPHRDVTPHAANPAGDPETDRPRVSPPKPVDDTRSRRSQVQKQRAAEDAPEGTAAAPAAPRRAEPAAPELPRQPELQAQSIRIGERSEERETPGALQAPDWAAEIEAALRERHGEPRPAAASEPTVNVTIGRIDIRAVRKESREPAPQAAAPRRIMSLDDYLAKRNGRQR